MTDKGLAALASAPALVQQLQEFALDAVKCTWQGAQVFISQCVQLRKIQLHGLQPVLQ